jgi:hypothetical protein
MCSWLAGYKHLGQPTMQSRALSQLVISEMNLQCDAPSDKVLSTVQNGLLWQSGCKITLCKTNQSKCSKTSTPSVFSEHGDDHLGIFFHMHVKFSSEDKASNIEEKEELETSLKEEHEDADIEEFEVDE